jgi:hypothetical protein
VGESHDLGMFRLDRDVGMNLEVAERAGKGQVLIRGEILFAKEQDFPIEQGPRQSADRGGREGFREIQAIDFRADGRRQRAQREVRRLQAARHLVHVHDSFPVLLA